MRRTSENLPGTRVISLQSASERALCHLSRLVTNQGLDTISTDPSTGADGKGECHDEHLPDEDSAGHRRLRRSRAGRPEGRGHSRKDRIRVARGARRSATHVPGELPRSARLLWQALRADRSGVQEAAARAVLAGQGSRGHRSRDSPQDGGGGPGDRGVGQGTWRGPDRDGLPGRPGDKEGHRREYLRCGYPPRSLPGAGGAFARASRRPRAVCPPARRLINAPLGQELSSSRAVTSRNPLTHNGAATAHQSPRFDPKGVPHSRFSGAWRYVEEPFYTGNFREWIFHAFQ